MDSRLEDAVSSTGTRRPPRPILLAWSSSMGILIAIESLWFEIPHGIRFQKGWNRDTTLFAIWFALFPFAYWVRRPLIEIPRGIQKRVKVWFEGTTPAHSPQKASLIRPWILSLIVVGSSWFTSWMVSQTVVQTLPHRTFGKLPPAYHDEYSYLFQSQTFLAGRTFFESHPVVPELFDQMHVLNEGRFASRYFPTTGCWLAPFVAMGKPYWGNWLAGSLSAFFLFWAGRLLGGNLVGFLSGLLLAFAPGVALFSNTLLAHHSCLMGLTLFLWAFLKMQQSHRKRYAIISGTSLAWAMLSRPMAAAGFALPFGIWFLCWMTNRTCSLKKKAKLFFSMGIPLTLGFGILFWYSSTITGEALRTPYQQYTDIYTPRHVYGFYNVSRGERHLGPKVIDHYDRWAEELDPPRAIVNLIDRMIASTQWTLGLIPIVMSLLMMLLCFRKWTRSWQLVCCGILTIHLVHIPYWYVGIMNWHYVFESAPLLLLIVAGIFQEFLLFARKQVRPLLSLWFSGLILLAMMGSYGSEPFWETSRMKQAVNVMAYSRLKYDQCQRLIEKVIPQEKGLVLVEHDPSDLHINYVTNPPDLNARILFGHARFDQHTLHEIQASFPNRKLYLYSVKERRLKPLLNRKEERK